MSQGYKSFRAYIKFGNTLPQVGEEYKVDCLNEKTEKNNQRELTIKVNRITGLEWDMNRGRILIRFEGYYQVDKEGLRLAK